MWSVIVLRWANCSVQFSHIVHTVSMFCISTCFMITCFAFVCLIVQACQCWIIFCMMHTRSLKRVLTHTIIRYDQKEVLWQTVCLYCHSSRPTHRSHRSSLKAPSLQKQRKKKNMAAPTHFFILNFPRFFFFLPICLVPWSVSFLSLFLLHSFALKSFALFLSICSSPPPFTPLLLSLAEL